MEIINQHTSSDFSETTDIFGITTLLHVPTGYKKLSIEGLTLYIFGRWSRMELFLDEETSLYKRGEEGILPDGLAERFGYEAHRFEHALIGYPRAEGKQKQRAYSNDIKYISYYQQDKWYREMKRKGQSPEPPSYRRKYSYSKTRFLDSHIKTREIWEENENTFVPLIAEHMISGEDIALFMQDTLDCILDKLAYRYTATRIHTLARKIRRADNGRIFEAKNFEAIYKALYLTLEQKERIKKAFGIEHNKSRDKYFLLGENT